MNVSVAIDANSFGILLGCRFYRHSFQHYDCAAHGGDESEREEVRS